MKIVIGILVFLFYLVLQFVTTITEINRNVDKIMENELNKREYD